MDTSGFVFSPKRFGRSAAACVYVVGNPSGTLEAPQGTLGVDAATGDIYQNTDGGTTWVLYAGGGGGGGDITAVVAGTNMTGGATSGSATLNLDTEVMGLEKVQIANADADPLQIYTTTIAHAGNGGGPDIENLGTYDCTAAPRQATACFIGGYARKSGGAEAFTNRGLRLDCDSQGDGEDIALLTGRGNVRLCQTSGFCTVGATNKLKLAVVGDQTDISHGNTALCSAGVYAGTDATGLAQSYGGIYAALTPGTGPYMNFEVTAAAQAVTLAGGNGVCSIKVGKADDKLGFFDAAAVVKQTAVTARAALETYGLLSSGVPDAGATVHLDGGDGSTPVAIPVTASLVFISAPDAEIEEEATFTLGDGPAYDHVIQIVKANMFTSLPSVFVQFTGECAPLPGNLTGKYESDGTTRNGSITAAWSATNESWFIAQSTNFENA